MSKNRTTGENPFKWKKRVTNKVDGTIKQIEITFEKIKFLCFFFINNRFSKF